MSKAIKIRTSGEVTQVDQEMTMEVLQHAVGGWIEPVSLGDAVMWADEEGLLKRKPVNRIGTALARHWGRNPGPIVGDVIITGTELNDVTQDVPDWVAAAVVPGANRTYSDAQLRATADDHREALDKLADS
jgi:hypothetical protein